MDNEKELTMNTLADNETEEISGGVLAQRYPTKLDEKQLEKVAGGLDESFEGRRLVPVAAVDKYNIQDGQYYYFVYGNNYRILGKAIGNNFEAYDKFLPSTHTNVYIEELQEFKDAERGYYYEIINLREITISDCIIIELLKFK